jgi:4-hydroxy-tetrahydrodipicolinate reductase
MLILIDSRKFFSKVIKMPIALTVIGSSGKMGKRVLFLALNDPDFVIASACLSESSPDRGKDLGELLSTNPLGIPLESTSDEEIKKADLIIDFSTASATSSIIRLAELHKKPLLIGTTGISSETELLIQKASQNIPILYSPNFSLGIAVCLEIVKTLAHSLQGTTIEIEETHHSSKKDSPSGTALALSKAINRPDIAIRSIRSGEAVGEHRVIFTCEGERIELKHEAFSRDAFAKGALLAAKFLIKQQPGLYTIRDLFGL